MGESLLRAKKQLFIQRRKSKTAIYIFMHFICFQQQGRNIVPASLGAMPHLVTNYMTVPLSQGRGQHAFQAHIPVGLRAATSITPPRVSVQRLPTLKPTNISTQVIILTYLFNIYAKTWWLTHVIRN